METHRESMNGRTRHKVIAKPVDRSAWISSVKYKNGFLAIFLRCQDRKDEPVALLYANVPSWMAGLISAGIGGVSAGRAYNKLLKGKSEHPYQRIEGRERVNELRKLLTS